MELLHQRLGHRSTMSLLAIDTANIWQDIEIMVDTNPLFTSCQISTINKNSRSKTPLNPKTPFKWVLVEIIPAISSNSLTKYTIFTNYLLIVGAYSNITKFYGMKNITTGEVVDKLDMFQAIFVKLDESVCRDMERIKNENDTQFTSKDFQKGISVYGVRLELVPPYHQEINGQVEVIWQTLQTIAHSIMVHAQI